MGMRVTQPSLCMLSCACVYVAHNHLLERGGQLELRLDLRPELLHLAPRLVVLPPHQLDDGRDDGDPHQQVDHRDQHVRGLLCNGVGRFGDRLWVGVGRIRILRTISHIP